MTAYFMIFITLIISYANAQIIDCDASGTCEFNSFDCDMVNNVDCYIKCLNTSSCFTATFNGGVGKMEIHCGPGACNMATFNGGDGDMLINCAQGACTGTKCYGGNGNLIAVCSGINACEESDKNCPAGKYCNITCSGRNACGRGQIRTGDGNTIMNIFASGNDALEDVRIYCPQNSIRGGTTNSCNIYGYNTPGSFMMSGLKIYAVEGYHDVNMICDNGNDGCFNDVFDSNTRARLYCAPVGNIWTTYCPLTWDANDTNMKCYKAPSASPTPHVCEDYLLPTEIPTIQPTNEPTTIQPTTPPTTRQPTTPPTTLYPTKPPTPSPTRYDPISGTPQILYVSVAGCDYGYCVDENYTNYDNKTNNDECDFNACGCNSACCSSTPSCQEQIDALTAYRESFLYVYYKEFDKIVNVNDTGVWSNSIYGLSGYGGEDQTRNMIGIVCFEIEWPFVCDNPIVEIEFEDIGYADVYHFNVSYQNEIEVAGCAGGIVHGPECGSWYECPVDVQPIDGPWTAGNGHAFWVIDSNSISGFRPQCSDPKRQYNVKISVNCSTIYNNPPRCRTLDYTWKCFNGIGGVPMDTICGDTGYDGNGEIQISSGEYTLNDNIFVQDPYQQVVMEGRGFNHTFLNQIVSNDNVAISCELCNFTMKGLTYHIGSSGSASLASNIIIQSFNGGNTTFDDVLFTSDIQGLKFIFSNYSKVEFVNCRFQKKVTFNIMNDATVSFKKCTFINIGGNLTQQHSILSVKNSVLSIIESVFAHNHDLDCIIQSSTYSDIVIQDSKFIENGNINYLWYSFESNGSMKNTTNYDNECVQEYCISAVDSNLLIDEISVVDDFMNTTSTSKMLEYGHNDNNTLNFNTLFLWDFSPQAVLPNIDLFNFHSANGRVMFVPCNRIEQSFRQLTIFDEISNGLIPTHVYNKSGAFDGETLNCNIETCYVKCEIETLTCFRTIFTATSVHNALFKCSSSSSCQEGSINISSTTISAILCNDSSACEKMKIYVSNTSNFTLECVMTGACTEIEIFIKNTSEANIKCFALNACDGMRVTSDSNEISIHIEMWSDDIIINVPSQHIPQYLHCNNDAYLSLDGSTFNSLDGSTFNSLQKSVVDLFGMKMPCQNVVYSFQTDVAECEIRYQMFSNNEVNETLTYLEYYMECFPPIYINQFVNYSCFGSVSPTKFPTTEPTQQPSLLPTSAPSAGPTSAPSQFPTAYDAFGDKWVDMEYDIKNLTIRNLEAIVSDMLFLAKSKIEMIISQSYVQSGADVGLEYREFLFLILKVNGIDADSKNLNIQNLKKRNQEIWKSAKSTRRLAASDLYNVRLTTQIYVDLTKTGSAIIVLSESPDFRNITLNKLRMYFANDDVEFIVNPNDDEFEIKQVESIEESDILLYVLIIFVTIICLITLAAFIYNQIPSTRVDESNYIAIMIYGLQIWDMVSDIILAFEITNKLYVSSNTSNIFLLIASVGSITFVVVPYFCNLLIAVNIKKLVDNNAAKVFLNNRSSVFITLCTFSGGAYASLALISSQIWGLDVFNAGLTQYELMKLGKLKILGTILLENLPQMICQLLYVYALQTKPTENTWLAFIASLLSIISSILTYWMNKSSVGNSKTTQYYISFENQYMALSKENKKQISKNKLKTKKLTAAITSEFSIYDKDIEIGYCRTTGHGLNYHIVHHLHDNDKATNPKLYIMQLYSKQKHLDKINDIFEKHFEFNKVQNADSSFSISIQHKDGDGHHKDMPLIANMTKLLTMNSTIKTEASQLLDRFFSSTNVDTAALPMMTSQEIEMGTLIEPNYDTIKLEVDMDNEIKEEADLKTEQKEEEVVENDMDKMDVTVGDRVTLSGDHFVGRLKFIGNIIGKQGVFYGVELNEANGKNDGSVNNIYYFHCGQNKGIFVKKQRIKKRLNQIENGKVRVNHGDVVKVKKFDCNGEVRYIGTPNGKKGVWYGIELYQPKGKNNGTVQGREYFKCPPNFGTFVTAENVILTNFMD